MQADHRGTVAIDILTCHCLDPAGENENENENEAVVSLMALALALAVVNHCCRWWWMVRWTLPATFSPQGHALRCIQSDLTQSR